MLYRSSTGGQHISGDITAGVGSSHGVQMSGGSTGGIIQAVGDDASISLNILAKGAGGITIGSSLQTVTIAGGLGLRGAMTSTSTWTAGAVSSGQPVELTFASTTFDVNPGDLIGAIEVWPTASTTPLAFLHYRTSTVVTSRLTVALGNIASTVTSTTSGHIRVTWLKFT
jgi:hypothetical protein